MEKKLFALHEAAVSFNSTWSSMLLACEFHQFETASIGRVKHRADLNAMNVCQFVRSRPHWASESPSGEDWNSGFDSVQHSGKDSFLCACSETDPNVLVSSDYPLLCQPTVLSMGLHLFLRPRSTLNRIMTLFVLIISALLLAGDIHVNASAPGSTHDARVASSSACCLSL